MCVYFVLQMGLVCERLVVVQRYVSAHPDVIVLDPIEKMKRMSDRRLQYRLVNECDFIDDESRFLRLFSD